MRQSPRSPQRERGSVYVLALLVLLILTIVGLALSLALGCGPARPERPRANLLLVILDTTRADRLGCYGWERAATPELDALARSGARFEAAYATRLDPEIQAANIAVLSEAARNSYLAISHRRRPTSSGTARSFSPAEVSP